MRQLCESTNVNRWCRKSSPRVAYCDVSMDQLLDISVVGCMQYVT